MFCHECGEKNEHNGKFCLKCGAELVRKTDTAEAAVAKPEKKKGKGLVIGLVVVILVAAAVAAVIFLAPLLRFNAAMDLMYARQYEAAAEAFEALGDYKNSESLAQEANYLYAEELMENGKFKEAYSVFKALKEYKDSDEKMLEAYYLYGLALLEQGECEKAVDVFAALGQYKDSGEKRLNANYHYAQLLLEKGKFSDAAAIFEVLGSYEESDSYLRYTQARSLEESGELTDAIALLEELGDFLDARKRCADLWEKIGVEDDVPPEDLVGYDGSEVTITFYHTMGSKLTAVLDTYIYEFNKLYPNIHIEYTAVGNYDDVRNQIGTEIAVGNQPHIAYCDPDHVALYNKAQAVQTLDNLISSTAVVTRADGTTEILGLTDEQKADFIAGYYNEGMQFGDGKMYTLPMSKSTEVLYYNKTFFDQHGLSVPTTWEEMEQVCAQIKAIDPSSIPLGYDSESNWFITMCEQYGSPYTSATGDHFLFDNETNRGFVKMFNSWYQKGYVTTQELYGAYTSGLFTTLEGTRSYMSIGSSAGATYQRPAAGADGSYPFEVGIATVPQVNPAAPKVISQGPSLCIFKKENTQEVLASWLFVKFLTTNVQFQAEFAMASGYVPVLKSVSENEVYADFLSKADGGDYIAALSAKVCMEQESAYYTSPAFIGSSTARDQVGLLMIKCIAATGDIDSVIAKAFADAKAECDYSAR